MLVLPFVPRVYDFNFASRFPGITQTEIITEVPDEVVEGRQLALCVRADRIIQECLMRFFRQTPGKLTMAACRKTGGMRLAWHPGRRKLEMSKSR